MPKYYLNLKLHRSILSACAVQAKGASFWQQTSRASACMRNSGGVFCIDVSFDSEWEERWA
jgi:hypothetical protein